MDHIPQIIVSLAAIAMGVTGAVVATAAETALLAVQALERQGALIIPERSLIHGLFSRQRRLLLALGAFNLAARLFASLGAALFFAALIPEPVLAAYLIGGLVAFLGSIIVTDILPKSIPESTAAPVAYFLAPFAFVIVQIAQPCLWVHLWLSRRIAEAVRQDGEEAVVSENEFRTMLNLGEIEGAIEEDTRDIIEGIIVFGDHVAADIMTPRSQLFALAVEELDAPDFLDRFRQGPYNRAIIFEKNIDHVLGSLSRKRLLLHPDRPARSLIAQPLYAPESRKLIDLLGDMKRSRIYFAIILDEYGGTAGVVTLQDMLQEIVGELEDDAMGQEDVTALGEGAWLVSGRMEIERLNDQLGLSLPDDLAHTVSGLVMGRLRRHPEGGDAVEVEPLRLTVTRMGRRRVIQVRIELLSETGGGAQVDPADPALTGSGTGDGEGRAT